jgi:hypothetical protein
MFATLKELDAREQFQGAGPVSQVCAYKGPDAETITWIKVVDVTYGYGAAAKKVTYGDPGILGRNSDEILKECLEIPQGTCVTAVAGDVGLFLENLRFRLGSEGSFTGLFASGEPAVGSRRRDAPNGGCLGAVSGWVGFWSGQEQVTALQVDWVSEDKIQA